MAYTATVIPVMIASPGDVAEERQVIREMIHEWNDINSARSKVMLTPIGWETHTSPELGVRPQKLINVTNGAIVIHTQRLKSDPVGNLLS